MKTISSLERKHQLTGDVGLYAGLVGPGENKKDYVRSYIA